jgi:transposase
VGRRGYPPEFRRKALDLVEAGRPVAEIAQALGISTQSIDTWRRQDRIDRGPEPGLTSAEKSELAAAKHRIAELETELRATRRAMELDPRVVVPPKAVPGGHGDGRRAHPGRGRLPGPGRIRFRATAPGAAGRRRHGRSAMPGPADLIVKVHQDSGGTYWGASGACRAAAWPRDHGRPHGRTVNHSVKIMRDGMECLFRA